MKLFLVLVLMFCAGTVTAQKRTYNYTSASARFFTDEEFRELIRSTAEEEALHQGVPVYIFNERYPEYRVALEKRVKPGIQKGFRWAEFTGKSAAKAAAGSEAFIKQKAIYTTQLRKAVAATLDDFVWSGLLSFDQSDRVVLFRSVVSVRSDGTQRVVEEITVYNGDGKQRGARRGEPINNKIQRGILRELPTIYQTELGFQKIVPLEIVSVLRNGQREPFSSSDRENGVEIRIGNEGVYLPVGLHTYRIEYEIGEQVGFFDSFDELTWNVTGNGWSFRIDSAMCEIHFPEGGNVLQQACYTGLQGATTNFCTFHMKDSTTIAFATTKALQPYEGLTVAAGIPKGVIAPPAGMAVIVDFFRDNLLLTLMAGVMLVIIALNLFFWWRVGRDPRGKTIHPQFEPPPGLSPAEVGYVIERDFKPHLAAASLIDAAVNGHVEIEVGEGGLIFKHPVYTINANSGRKPKETSYKSFGDESSLNSIGTVEKGKYNSALKSFSSSVSKFLEERHLIDPQGEKRKGGLFAHNASLTGPGVVLLMLSFIGAIIFIAANEIQAPGLLVATLLVFILAIIVQGIFSRLLGAYSAEGRALADSILGFRMYLEAADKHTFDALMPPEKTLELFERYLPFAVALKVENRWAEQFEGILGSAVIAGSSIAQSRNLSSFSSYSSSFAGSLSTAISSASTPPGSSSGSSGSSGGGSSGSGGGGGGGGGW